MIVAFNLIVLLAMMGGLRASLPVSLTGERIIGEAQQFLNDVRGGQLPSTAEVIVNAGREKKYLSSADASDLLKSCQEGVLKWTSIPNRDGTVDPHVKTVETRFACSGHFASYTGAAGVVLFENDKIIRLVFQVDGYAAAFPRRLSNG